MLAYLIIIIFLLLSASLKMEAQELQLADTVLLRTKLKPAETRYLDLVCCLVTHKREKEWNIESIKL